MSQGGFEEEKNSEPIAWICALPSCTKTFSNGFCFMRHWNGDHKTENLPRNYQPNDDSLVLCYSCETIYPNGERH